MTKKFIHSNKSTDVVQANNEFLIPDIYFGSNKLIGLKTLKEYDSGTIVYTGVELNINVVYNRAFNRKKIAILKRIKAKRKLALYLIQLKSIKIGTKVGFNKNGYLIKVN